MQTLPWFDKEPDIVQLYIDYLANLISAQTFYLKSTLTMLLQQLWVPTNPTSVCCNIHQAMDAILQLVPTAPSVLLPLLTKNYPFKGKGPDIQVSSLFGLYMYIGHCIGGYVVFVGSVFKHKCKNVQIM